MGGGRDERRCSTVVHHSNSSKITCVNIQVARSSTRLKVLREIKGDGQNNRLGIDNTWVMIFLVLQKSAIRELICGLHR